LAEFALKGNIFYCKFIWKGTYMRKGILVAAFSISAVAGVGTGLIVGLIFGLPGSAVAGITAGVTCLVMRLGDRYFGQHDPHAQGVPSRSNRDRASPPQP
jgi:hypothetical protein